MLFFWGGGQATGADSHAGRGRGLYLFYRPCMVDAMEKRYKVKTDEGGQAAMEGAGWLVSFLSPMHGRCNGKKIQGKNRGLRLAPSLGLLFHAGEGVDHFEMFTCIFDYFEFAGKDLIGCDAWVLQGTETVVGEYV